MSRKTLRDQVYEEYIFEQHLVQMLKGLLAFPDNTASTAFGIAD